MGYRQTTRQTQFRRHRMRLIRVFGDCLQDFLLNFEFKNGLNSMVYKLKNIVGSYNFSAQFIEIISHYKKIGYNIYVLQQTACLVVNPITFGNFAFLYNSDFRLYDGSDLKTYLLMRW